MLRGRSDAVGCLGVDRGPLTVLATVVVVLGSSVCGWADVPAGMDRNCDGTVDGADVAQVMSVVFGGTSVCSGEDLDGDGWVTAADVSAAVVGLARASAPNHPPDGTITDPSAPPTVAVGVSVSFSGAGSDPDGDAVDLLWDFGDGSWFLGGSPPAHAYAAEGTFVVSLTAVDAPGLLDPTPSTLVVTVTESGGELERLSVGGPMIATEGDSVAFTATAVFIDGSMLDVSQDADWSANLATFELPSGQGIVPDLASDRRAEVTATWDGGGGARSASRDVLLVDRPENLTGSHAGRIDSYSGTATCISCHENEALDMHQSVHYQWVGDASETTGLTDPIAGKLGGINDFCIYPDINWIGKLTTVGGVDVDGGCAKCHAGLGLKPGPDPTPEQLENIDCLVCHSTSYERTVRTVGDVYRFVPDIDSMDVGVLQSAVDVGRPSSASCLSCHASSGGGDNYKRGDLESAHAAATPSLDVHMASVGSGGAGLECLSCHTASNHRIAGRGVDLRPRELADPVTCEGCHSPSPHDSETLNDHAVRVACESCHIPDFARTAPTDMVRDWSVPGDVSPHSGLFEPNRLMSSHVTPEYRFFNGRTAFYEFGSAAVAGASGNVAMAEPLGDITDPEAKIYPFKHHLAIQAADPATDRLLPLKIGIFFQSNDVDAAIRQGVAAVGWDVPEYEFVETERWMGLFHEVTPAGSALGCSDCHNGGTRLDFDALGYGPNETYDGEPLCRACHGPKTAPFEVVHSKHVDDEQIDCINCHQFSAVGR